MRDAGVERRKTNLVAGPAHTERQVEGDLQHATVTHGDHGLVFVPAGFPKGILVAIRPDGRGDATAARARDGGRFMSA